MSFGTGELRIGYPEDYSYHFYSFTGVASGLTTTLRLESTLYDASPFILDGLSVEDPQAVPKPSAIVGVGLGGAVLTRRHRRA